ncbi:hypothetical protein ACCAA_1120016 [Candidatus Accumulibacter aalborgensis]|uniref:Uncharacterized protein n=1 Tax=Candidatus Accumulibacter aalborgensis TaxID=1860102 RepID=A0A1A8XIJ3_9PROT|nr:hypothetical protein ACCAA_1120016 [Candidatus Accumulibacter aalborgensis]
MLAAPGMRSDRSGSARRHRATTGRAAIVRPRQATDQVAHRIIVHRQATDRVAQRSYRHQATGRDHLLMVKDPEEVASDHLRAKGRATVSGHRKGRDRVVVSGHRRGRDRVVVSGHRRGRDRVVVSGRRRGRDQVVVSDHLRAKGRATVSGHRKGRDRVVVSGQVVVSGRRPSLAVRRRGGARPEGRPAVAKTGRRAAPGSSQDSGISARASRPALASKPALRSIPAIRSRCNLGRNRYSALVAADVG